MWSEYLEKQGIPIDRESVQAEIELWQSRISASELASPCPMAWLGSKQRATKFFCASGVAGDFTRYEVVESAYPRCDDTECHKCRGFA